MNNEEIEKLIDNKIAVNSLKSISELKDIQLDIEKQKNNVAESLKKIDSSLEASNSKITEIAIDKTLRILEHIRNWMLVIGVIVTIIITIAGVIGYNNLMNSLSTYYKSEVEKWLRYEDDESGAKQSLEEIRTKALIDSYMIKLARIGKDGYGNSLVDLSAIDLQRLTNIACDPKTNDSDFFDVLKIISSSMGPFHSIVDNEIGNRISTLLESNKISNNKKIVILDLMRLNRELLKYTIPIMTDDKYDEQTRIMAFQNIKNFRTEDAIKFAKENVTKFQAISNKNTLAEYLIKSDLDTKKVTEFMDLLYKNKPDSWASIYSNLALSLYKADNKTASKLSEKYLRDLIKLDAKIVISDFDSSEKHFGINLGGTTSELDAMASLFKDNAYINSLIHGDKTNEDSIKNLTHYVNFFDVIDNNYQVTTLIVKLSSGASITTKSNGKIKSDQIINDVWLHRDHTNDTIDATWRNELGTIHNDQIVGINNIDKASFYLSYDEHIINNLANKAFNHSMTAY